jgi:hypothetical protein
MSTVDKAELVEKMCIEVDDLARLGIAYREGDVSPQRERYLLAIRRYGRAFADEYFGPDSKVPAP